MLYLLFNGVVFALLSSPPFFDSLESSAVDSIGDDYSVIDAVRFISTIAITIAGTLFGYIANRDGDNRDFITRFVCLSVPVAIRMIAIALIVAFPVGVVGGLLSLGKYCESTYRVELFLMVWEMVILGLFYVVLCARIGEVAKGRAA